VANILRRHGIPPSPVRKPDLPWSEFIATHQDVISACDFFTAEVFTARGLVTFYVLFFIQIGSRGVHIAGVTPHPNEAWMNQVARNLTMDGWGFLNRQRHLIFDRDTKFCASFRRIVRDAGVKLVRLPPMSPNLNAYAERFVRTIKDECLSRLVLFGEDGLRRALVEFVGHYHEERNHQGKGNLLLFPTPAPAAPSGPVECRERLGGLLKFYRREAA
jgi:sugar phosphate isomerase/epimerase